MTLLDSAHELAPELVDLRRALHRVPELDRQLPMTQALVLDALDGLDLEVTTGTALSLGHGGAPGRCARRHRSGGPAAR